MSATRPNARQVIRDDRHDRVARVLAVCPEFYQARVLLEDGTEAWVRADNLDPQWHPHQRTEG